MDEKVREQQQATIEHLLRENARWRAIARENEQRAVTAEVEVRRMVTDRTYVV